MADEAGSSASSAVSRQSCSSYSSSASASKLLDLPSSDLLQAVVAVLSRCTDVNGRLLNGKKQSATATTRFHAAAPPDIPLSAYLKRLVSMTPYPSDAILLSLLYINRITHLSSAAASGQAFEALFGASEQRIYALDKLSRDPAPHLSIYTVHRLILASLAIAAAFISDSYIDLARSAKVGGISKREFHNLQLELFAQLSFDCCFSQSELESVCREIWLSTERGKAEQAAQSIVASIDVPVLAQRMTLANERRRLPMSEQPALVSFTPTAGYDGDLRSPSSFCWDQSGSTPSFSPSHHVLVT